MRRVRQETVLRDLNAFRAPGPTGVFAVDVRTAWSSETRFFTWEGWPANDRGTVGRRPDLDGHYRRLTLGIRD